MGDRKIRHVEDIFTGRIEGDVQVHNLLDRKTSFNMYKKKRAPEPPQDGGKAALPKIGNYQPKIFLQSESPLNVDNTNNDHSYGHRDSVNTDKPRSPVRNEQFIIGDKDVPLKIENNIENADDMPVAAPRRKRRAPSVPEDSEIRTNNPLFGRSVSQKSDEERFDINFDEQGGDIDFGVGIDNPSFNSRDRKESDSSWNKHSIHAIPEERQNGTNDQYPYIPPPDYEDEEMTFEFGEEDDEIVVDHNRNSTIYKEFEGEDFGKYLNEEEDYEFDAPPSKHQRRTSSNQTQSRPGPLKPPAKVIDNKKDAKSKKKYKQKEVTKRSTIRDFAFSDSKIGWGDRTVNSTSAKGRYIKREKDRRRIDKTDPFEQKNNKPTSGSYEEFLRVKNGLPVESPNSSDSGVDIWEEGGPQRDMYINSQPKQMRSGKYDRKQSMWQRLTWRFRKSVNITNAGER